MSLAEILRNAGLELVAERVAEGGTAIVHRAQVVETRPPFANNGDLIAIKEYKPAILQAPAQQDRIRQEAQLGASVKHPKFVTSYGFIESSDSRILLAMEWVDGQQLDKWVLAPDSAKDWESVRRIALEILSALEALHQAKILHRDVKAENVIIDTAGHAKLMDLGIAEYLRDDAVTMHTQVKDFIGSIRFASPQFVRGEPFDPADDVYAFGTVLFELVTGSRVYDEVERKTTLAAEILRRPPTIPNLRSDVPASVRTILQGTFNADRRRRPTLAELRNAIELPEGAAYVQRELDAQSQEQRGYVIIGVEDGGRSAYANLRGEEVGTDRVWTVARRGAVLNVPSRGGRVATEKWVALVKLKHVHQGVGHFLLVRERWQEGSSSGGIRSMFAFGGGGHYEYDEVSKSEIKVGDFVIKPD